ncbi:MAG: hypothetical protein A6F71_03995 [Cycloclasticus sp. symbiont of Poecilosclerida sp. M]|nr:MAG: hypothetical protein A6F71_03995 [Cycloclasticus sp. symbiont of Poecilosclerida sp. M]
MLLSIIDVIVLSVITVAPTYLEHYYVTQSMDAVEEDVSIKGMQPFQIRNLLLKKLDVNAVTSVTARHIKIFRSTDDISVEVNYVVRKEYIGNLDVIMTFT